MNINIQDLNKKIQQSSPSSIILSPKTSLFSYISTFATLSLLIINFILLYYSNSNSENKNISDKVNTIEKILITNIEDSNIKMNELQNLLKNKGKDKNKK